MDGFYAVRFDGAAGGFGRGVAGRFEIALRSVAGNFWMRATASRKFLPYWFFASAMLLLP